MWRGMTFHQYGLAFSSGGYGTPRAYSLSPDLVVLYSSTVLPGFFISQVFRKSNSLARKQADAGILRESELSTHQRHKIEGQEAISWDFRRGLVFRRFRRLASLEIRHAPGQVHGK